MKFNNVSVFEDMVPVNHLAFKFFGSPNAGKLEFFGKILVDQCRCIQDGAPSFQYKRIVRVSFFPRRLGKDSKDILKLFNLNEA